MTRRRCGRYIALQRAPGRFIVYDGRRDRKKGFRTYRGRRGFQRAEARAAELNRKAAR